MRFRLQTADYFARRQPTWLRALTIFCVLWLGVASTAQAAHIHGQWLPHSGPEVSKHNTGPITTTEDACPLCVAMHSAMPAQLVAATPAAIVALPQVFAVAEHSAPPLWHFELFSRPPPALL